MVCSQQDLNLDDGVLHGLGIVTIDATKLCGASLASTTNSLREELINIVHS